MENRQFIRTQFSSRVKIILDSGIELIANTSDVSDGGIFVSLNNEQRNYFCIDQLVKIQVIDMPIEAPVVLMRIVRLIHSGIGLQFAKQ